MQHFFGSPQFYFRRALLEQQNAARAGQMQSMNSLGSALMSGGNVMNTPQAPRGLTSMSPAPQQLSRPRKILSLHDYHFLFISSYFDYQPSSLCLKITEKVTFNNFECTFTQPFSQTLTKYGMAKIGIGGVNSSLGKSLA